MTDPLKSLYCNIAYLLQLYQPLTHSLFSTPAVVFFGEEIKGYDTIMLQN